MFGDADSPSPLDPSGTPGLPGAIGLDGAGAISMTGAWAPGPPSGVTPGPDGVQWHAPYPPNLPPQVGPDGQPFPGTSPFPTPQQVAESQRQALDSYFKELRAPLRDQCESLAEMNAKLGHVNVGLLSLLKMLERTAGGELYEPASVEEIRKVAATRGWNVDIANRLWDGPPLIKKHVRGCPGRGGDVVLTQTCVFRGCIPFKGALITCSRQRDTQLNTGGIVNLDVGDPSGGGVTGTRTFLIGDGFPGWNALGSYGGVHAELTQISNVTHRARITWTDGGSWVGSAVNSLLRAPAIVSDGGAIAERVVPEGAVQAFSTTAVTFTWRDYATLGGGVAVAFPDPVAAAGTTRVRGNTFATNAAARVQFYLAPL